MRWHARVIFITIGSSAAHGQPAIADESLGAEGSADYVVRTDSAMGDGYSTFGGRVRLRFRLSPYEAEPGLHPRGAQLYGVLWVRRTLRLLAQDHVDYDSPQAVPGVETFAGWSYLSPKEVAGSQSFLISDFG